MCGTSVFRKQQGDSEFTNIHLTGSLEKPENQTTDQEEKNGKDSAHMMSRTMWEPPRVLSNNRRRNAAATDSDWLLAHNAQNKLSLPQERKIT